MLLFFFFYIISNEYKPENKIIFLSETQIQKKIHIYNYKDQDSNPNKICFWDVLQMWFVLFLDRIDIYEVIEVSINFNFFRAINKEINSNTDEQAIL